jgi:hypothetical protein
MIRIGMVSQPIADWFRANAAEVIADVLKIATLIAAALTVVFQLRKQHKNSLALQRENAREALKLRIYETLVSRIRAVADANIAAAIYAFGIPPALDGYRKGGMPVSQRAMTFSELHSKAEASVAELLVEFDLVNRVSQPACFPGRI